MHKGPMIIVRIASEIRYTVEKIRHYYLPGYLKVYHISPTPSQGAIFLEANQNRRVAKRMGTNDLYRVDHLVHNATPASSRILQTLPVQELLP